MVSVQISECAWIMCACTYTHTHTYLYFLEEKGSTSFTRFSEKHMIQRIMVQDGGFPLVSLQRKFLE